MSLPYIKYREIFLPGFLKWVNMIIYDCSKHRRNRCNRYDLNKAPFQQLGELETNPSSIMQVDHRGRLRAYSNCKHCCLVVVDVFSRHMPKCAVKADKSEDTIRQMEKFGFYIFE